MYIIQTITDAPKQTQNWVLQDGSVISVVLEYKPLQFGWFFTSISYGTFVLNGLRVCNNPNMLHQFKNQIPFGLACFTVGSREPTQIQDFLSNASQMFLLSKEEVEQYTRFLSGGS